MNSWERRLRKMEERMPSVPTDQVLQNCGLGIPIPFSQAQDIWGRECPVHGYSCWRRESPIEIAQVAMILQAMNQGRPANTDETPPQELVEEARQMLLRDGVELFIDG
jgi:hypothetical protein